MQSVESDDLVGCRTGAKTPSMSRLRRAPARDGPRGKSCAGWFHARPQGSKRIVGWGFVARVPEVGWRCAQPVQQVAQHSSSQELSSRTVLRSSPILLGEASYDGKISDRTFSSAARSYAQRDRGGQIRRISSSQSEDFRPDRKAEVAATLHWVGTNGSSTSGPSGS